MSDPNLSKDNAQAPSCSECAVTIQWGSFSFQLKSARWGLLALILTMLSCAAIAWAPVAWAALTISG